jgi:Rps23 Pro-64 3,4-dihydroxylase Tpa1-like proline 4-hydroxylase
MPTYDDLPSNWQRFITEIISPAHIKSVLELAGMVTRDYKINIGFYTFNNGGWISPHIDNPGKIFTQIFYFNPYWDVSWGGNLNLLRSKDSSDLILSIPPLSHYTATIYRSNNAWHMVDPVVPKNNVKRLSLQLEVLEDV